MILGPSSIDRPGMPISPPIRRHRDRRDQPKQGIDKINPNRILHPLYAPIALDILVDKQIPEYPKEDNPHQEEDRVPDKDERYANDEGNHVDEGGEGR